MMRTLLLWLATCLTLGAAGHRIASYSPGATQTLVDLGCSAEIVMATRWCPLPKDHPAARDADVFMPDLERLLRTKPDLVILPRMANPLWAEKCAKAGLRTLVLNPESRDSVSKDILRLGEATGRADTASGTGNDGNGIFTSHNCSSPEGESYGCGSVVDIPSAGRTARGWVHG